MLHPSLVPLLAALVMLAPQASAQVAVSPAAVEVSLPAGQATEVKVVVRNGGTAAVNLFAVPLPEEGAPEDVGELLLATEPGVVGDPYDLAMTSEGRFFVARRSGVEGQTTVTWELSPELDSLRFFVHPVAEEASSTTGVAWMPPERAPPGHSEGTL